MQKSQKFQWLGPLKAGVCALLGFALLSLILSAVLLKKELAASWYFPLLLGAAGISGLCGGVCATRKERKNGLVNGALAAVLPCLAYLAAAAGSSRGFAWGSLLPCFVLLACSIVGGVAAANKKMKPKIKKRK